MKICAVYNVWSDQQLLALSMKNMEPLVDGMIIVYSTLSNFWEKDPEVNFEDDYRYNAKYFLCEPEKGLAPVDNERRKRNFGLQKARELGYTHFIMMDADEFYEHEAFKEELKRFENPNLLGLVARVKCYFRSAKLTIGYDTTLVPFVHKITPELKFAWNTDYPFAWTVTDERPRTDKKMIRIDPTRQMNITGGVEWSYIVMHHMSWVRDDIQKKIRNSTARPNIERSSILTDYCQAKEGYFCQFYGKTLVSSPNVFGIPDIHDSKSLQLCKEPGSATRSNSTGQ